MTSPHCVLRANEPDPRWMEIQRERLEQIHEQQMAIAGRVEDALRHMFERGQITPDTVTVTFMGDATKRAIVVGEETVWEGRLVQVSAYRWEWRERWL